MKWTNIHNLPQPVVSVVTNDKYSKGESDISITGLSKPPRMRVLEKIHADEITADVSDRISALLGKGLHAALESANSTGLAETRFYLEIDGVLVSGQTDAFYADGTLDDYKLLPIRKASELGLKDDDFVAQLNSYAYLMKYGYYLIPPDADGRPGETKTVYPKYETKTLRIVAFFRDWFQAGIQKAAKDGFYYPPAQCQVYELPKWDDGKTLLYLKDRIAAHKAANSKLPRCTDEERWAEPDRYAVIKPGAKKSLKNHDSKEMAEQHSLNTPGTVVEVRKGGSKRCKNWCDAAPFCSQYLKEIQPNEK